MLDHAEWINMNHTNVAKANQRAAAGDSQFALMSSTDAIFTMYVNYKCCGTSVLIAYHLVWKKQSRCKMVQSFPSCNYFEPATCGLNFIHLYLSTFKPGILSYGSQLRMAAKGPKKYDERVMHNYDSRLGSIRILYTVYITYIEPKLAQRYCQFHGHVRFCETLQVLYIPVLHSHLTGEWWAGTWHCHLSTIVKSGENEIKWARILWTLP